ncbi:MAG: transcription-repair coupling factor, partial [Selenomonadaceae bacterium]|nr:transcription-repair coupling factor [Selenomonadaceae bacterium]
MNEILSALLLDNTITEIADAFTKQRETLVYGLADSQKTAAFAAAYARNPQPTVVLVPNRDSINLWFDDLSELLPDVDIVEYPELDLIDVNAAVRSLERTARRMSILERILEGDNLIIIATTTAAVKKVVSRKYFLNYRLKLARDDSIKLERLFDKLIDFGYERTDEVDSPGQFTSRGGIVDIYPLNSSTPFRLEFFDDMIDSIREFDVDTKRSIKNVDAVSIMPVNFASDKINPEPFMMFVERGAIVFDEPNRIIDTVRNLIRENPDIKRKIFSFENLIDAARNQNAVVYFSLMLKKVRSAEIQSTIGLTAMNLTGYQDQSELFIAELKSRVERKQRLILLAKHDKKLAAIKTLLLENGLDFALEIGGSQIVLLQGQLTNGFEIPTAHLCIFTEREIFGRQKRQTLRAARASKGERIRHFRDIRPGDYVVHTAHGIGKYVGVETLEVGGLHRDYLHIKYAGTDKLFVPTDQVQFLQKYIANEDSAPKLNKLNSTEWAKAKARAAASVEDIADKLIDIYARRQASKGFEFALDDMTQKNFEEAFAFEETDDQLRAVEEIKADMESARPMDRLVCGDVGFGKTEIAIRAAYKAAMNGKQTAVLVPTTVLAQQHFQTFSERFAGFLPTVDVICRFRTAKEQQETLKRLKAGQVDILIGTHAILNTDRVKFKDLGLLIVDEEQRFGVKHKEKIRDLSAGIDVLSLSATPIPRTLHMSLVGARDMSVIETPPSERFPVQTYVIENDDEIIAEAIRRELRRGGQIFFVYNRVETIDKMRVHIERLVPEARIQTAHGQMADEFLEQVMMDFYEGAFDVLLATSIIENGLNVANANTIIVWDADRFGLAQLYQIRGRVGRSHRMAFAYFVYREDKILTETAEKRLHAMKEFAQLGAGFKIAMRDLEIRGAGNLLGAQQHGHIASVGFEMYCQLLEEA